MSEPSHAQPYSTIENRKSKIENPLDPSLAAMLETGLTALPAPAPQPDFNQQVLSALHSGREFERWPQQTWLRLQWMLIPMLLGFALTFALTLWHSRNLSAVEPIDPKPGPVVPAPALPPLPGLQPETGHL